MSTSCRNSLQGGWPTSLLCPGGILLEKNRRSSEPILAWPPPEELAIGVHPLAWTERWFTASRCASLLAGAVRTCSAT
eukprot:11275260-Alexandrium_andersonii.AAC.1